MAGQDAVPSQDTKRSFVAELRSPFTVVVATTTRPAGKRFTAPIEAALMPDSSNAAIHSPRIETPT
jgi:hypothetical protein